MLSSNGEDKRQVSNGWRGRLSGIMSRMLNRKTSKGLTEKEIKKISTKDESAGSSNC